jgi:hypothetical protein
VNYVVNVLTMDKKSCDHNKDYSSSNSKKSHYNLQQDEVVNEVKLCHEMQQGIMVMNEVMPHHEYQQDLIFLNGFEIEVNINDQLNPIVLFSQNYKDH